MDAVFDNEYLPIRTLRRQARTELALPRGSFRGQTVLITGASGAICSRAAGILVDLEADTLIFAVPDIPEGPDGAPRLEALLGQERLRRARVLVWNLDLLSFDSVKAVAARAADLPRLDVALMGAAIIVTERRESCDGWEYTLQVNHLSCALLTTLLTPILTRSAETHGTTAVLSTISSLSVRTAALFVPARRPGESLLGAVSRVSGYAQQRQQYGVTKLLHLHWLRELCRRTPGCGPSSPEEQRRPGRVQVHACDFGVARGVQSISTVNWEARAFGAIFGRRPEMCARAVAGSCLARDSSHGALFLDYDAIPYYSFMDSEKGQDLQRAVWRETKEVLAGVSADARKFYEAIEADPFKK